MLQWMNENKRTNEKNWIEMTMPELNNRTSFTVRESLPGYTGQVFKSPSLSPPLPSLLPERKMQATAATSSPHKQKCRKGLWEWFARTRNLLPFLLQFYLTLTFLLFYVLRRTPVTWWCVRIIHESLDNSAVFYPEVRWCVHWSWLPSVKEHDRVTRSYIKDIISVAHKLYLILYC